MTIDTAVVQERLRLIRELLDDLSDIGEVTASRLRRERITGTRWNGSLLSLWTCGSPSTVTSRRPLLSEAPATYRESFGAAARAGAISEELGAQLAGKSESGRGAENGRADQRRQRAADQQRDIGAGNRIR